MLEEITLPRASRAAVSGRGWSRDALILGGIAVLTIAYLYLLGSDTVDPLRGNVQWHIPYVAHPRDEWWWLPVIPGAIIAALPLLPLPSWASIGVGMCAACAFAYNLFAAQWGGGDNLLAKIINEPTGFHRAAGQITDMGAVLANYTEYIAQFALGSHVRSHPPGNLLLFRGLNDLMAAWPALQAATLNWGKTFISGLPMLLGAGNPAYLMAGAVAAIPLIIGLGRLAALPVALSAKWLGVQAVPAMLLFLVLPTTLVHIPLLDTVYPLLTGLVVLAGLAAVERASWPLGLVSGLLFGVSLLFSASLTLIVVPLIVYGLFRLRLKALPLGIAAAGGTAAVWAVLWLGWRLNMPQVMQYLSDHQRDFEATRSYWLWFRWKWYDFVMFCGIPVAALSIKFLVESIGRWRERKPLRIDYFFAGWLLMMIWLWLTPAALAEAGRLWAPVMCFAVFFAAYALPRWRGALPLVLLLEIAQVMVINRYLEVINSG